MASQRSATATASRQWVKAIEAGADILAITNNPIFDEKGAAKAIAVIRQLVQDGKINEARIDQSYQRIMRLKARRG